MAKTPVKEDKINMDAVKTTAIAMLYLPPQPVDKFPFLCHHPFFENQMTWDVKENRLIDIYSDEEGRSRIQKNIEESIKKADNIHLILSMMRTPYHFTFLKYTKDYLDKKTFSKLLASVWVNTENPNQDTNVSISTFIRWFKSADRKVLMSEKEYEYYSDLPEEITVYRGVAVGRAESEGLSWTCNYNTAKWFSNRFNTGEKKGYILKGTVSKKDVFAYFNSRDEDEICCNSKKVYNIERIYSKI